MLDFESLSSGAPVPTVDVNDLKRVWEFTREATGCGDESRGTVGIASELIAAQCSQGADTLAVFFRAALIGPLMEKGLLDRWREGDRPHDVVFRTLATFPLPNGFQGFDLDEFARMLKDSD